MNHRNSLYLNTPSKIQYVLSLEKDERKIEEEDVDEVSEWFKNASTLFQELKPSQLNRMFQHLEVVHVKPDHVIVHQGEEGTCLYVILQGCTTVYAKDTHDHEKGGVEPILPDVSVVRGAKERMRFGTELCILYPGKCFGEISVITGRERNASVIADEACYLIKLDRELYKNYIQEGAATEIILRTCYVTSHPFFRTWLTRTRDIIAENLNLKHYKFGEEIFREGENADSVYFVLEGQVKITINPSAELGGYSRLLENNLTSKSEDNILAKDEQHLDPFKNLTVLERRKLRREEGYYASEKRYRELSVCIVGSQGLIGDIEATLDLPTYTATATCIQELKLYEMKKVNFMQLILQKNNETYEKIRSQVHEKLEFRNAVKEGGVPIYNALLTYFQKAKPKDCRKQILKSYAKRKSNKVVSMAFFSEMSKGRTNNMPKARKDAKHAVISSLPKMELKRPISKPSSKPKQVTKTEAPSKQLLSLWRKTATNVIIKKKEQKETAAPKQFTADEYKTLKKKMQALGKSTQNNRR